MTGTTTGGWPYVTPTDHPKEYPAHSQALANLLQSRDSGGLARGTTSVPSSVTGTQVLTLATPTVWGDVTFNSSALYVARAGIYEVTVSGAFAGSGAGTVRGLWAGVDADALPPSGQMPIGTFAPPTSGSTGIGFAQAAAGMWQLTAGQRVRGFARQDSGSPLSINASLTLRYVHP